MRMGMCGVIEYAKSVLLRLLVYLMLSLSRRQAYIRDLYCLENLVSRSRLGKDRVVAIGVVRQQVEARMVEARWRRIQLQDMWFAFPDKIVLDGPFTVGPDYCTCLAPGCQHRIVCVMACRSGESRQGCSATKTRSGSPWSLLPQMPLV